MTFVSGSGALHTVQLAQTSLAGVTAGASGLDASIDWGQLATVTTQFDTDAVRQGRAVDPVNTVTRPIAGTVTANWNVADLTLTTPLLPFVLDVGNTGFSTTGMCDIKFSGASYVCHLESAPQAIVDPSDFPGHVRRPEARGRHHGHARGADDAAHRVDRWHHRGDGQPRAHRDVDDRPALGVVHRWCG